MKFRAICKEQGLTASSLLREFIEEVITENECAKNK